MESQKSDMTKLTFHCHFGCVGVEHLGAPNDPVTGKDEFSSRVILTGGHNTKMPSSMWTVNLCFLRKRMSSYEITEISRKRHQQLEYYVDCTTYDCLLAIFSTSSLSLLNISVTSFLLSTQFLFCTFHHYRIGEWQLQICALPLGFPP